MTNPTIYSTEPMATRALAAEIRHDPDAFVGLLARATGVEALAGLRSVRCEATARLDLELHLARPTPTTVGIEAKFDHEITQRQLRTQLAVVDHLVLLVPDPAAVPAWARELPRVGVLSWADALSAFHEPRLTPADIASMPLSKSVVEARLAGLAFDERMPGWSVEIRRSGSGMPSIVVESDELPNGRTLRGQIQVVGRGMPKPGEPIFVEYSIGVAVPATPEEYPDPDAPHVEPGWIAALRALRDEVLAGELDRLLVSTRRPGNGSTVLGRRKLPLAERYLDDDAWLAKGYTDGWALGPKSLKQPLGQLELIADAAAEIFTRWFAVESRRLAG